MKTAEAFHVFLLINFDDFNHLDIRIGTIISANFFEKAIKPAYQLIIDFGLLGKLNSSAQITELYQPENLIGKQVVVVVNIGKIKIENFVRKTQNQSNPQSTANRRFRRNHSQT